MKSQVTDFNHSLKPIILTFISLIMPLFFFGQDAFDYESAWKDIDKIMQDRQYRSADAKIKEVMAAASSAENDPQYIKGLLKHFIVQQRTTENSDSLIIERMKEEEGKGSTVRQAVVRSLLASMYQQYFEYNRWRIMERNQLDSPAGDYQTWDTKTFAQVITDLHLKALEEVDLLQQTPIEAYEALLIQSEQSARYRPTLFDLLAHRAIEFFQSSGLMVPESGEGFKIKPAKGFLPVKDFVNQDFSSTDSANASFRIIEIYQRLLAFHLEENNTFPLYDLDLKRLEFVKSKTQAPDAYRTAIEELVEHAPQHPGKAAVQMALADIYLDLKENTDYSATEEERKNSYKKALEICRKVIDTYPKSEGGEQAYAMKSRIESKSLQLEGEDYNLSKQDARFLLSYKNIEKVYFRLIELDDKVKKNIDGLRYLKDEKLARYLRRQRVLQSWSAKLPQPGDYFEHGVEIAIPDQGPGEYLLLASDNADFSIEQHALAYMEHRVSDLSHFYFLANDKHHFFVLDRKSGEPLPEIEAQVYRKNMDRRDPFRNDPSFKEEETLLTNKRGGLVIPRKYEKEDIYVIFNDGKQSWKAVGQSLYYFNRDKNSVEKRERRIINIFTDRAIYRPGQTIHYKGILVGKTEVVKPYVIEDENLTISFYDANNQKLTEQRVKTNEYGSFSGTFIAPIGGLNGRMRIQTPHGSHYVRVEEYKRPTFKVEVDTVEGNYAFGDEVEVSGLAEAFSGAPISAGVVNYRVIRSQELPWWYYYRWNFTREPEKEIANGSISTDEKGRFSFNFLAEPGKSASSDYKPIYRYKVIVDVVDLSGETRTGTSSVRIGERSLEVSIQAPQNIDLEDPGILEILTRNLNGKFVPTQGKIQIIPLKVPDQVFRGRRWEQPDQVYYSEKEFRKHFPNDVYKSEDNFYNWEEQAPFFERDFRSEENKTFDLSELKNAEAGKYKVIFTTAEEKIEGIAYFTLYDPDKKTLPTPTLLSYEVSVNPLEPGQTATLSLKTTEKKLWILYQLIKADEVLEEKWVELKKGSEEIAIPIKEEYRGNVAWRLSYIYQNEYHGESAVLEVPWSNKKLQMEWMTFRSPLQPGQKERWKLKVKGPKAEQVAAEMVATLYDASLDEFVAQDWNLNLYPTFSAGVYLRSSGFGTSGSQLLEENWSPITRYSSPSFDRVNFFGFYLGAYGARGRLAGYGNSFDGEAYMLAAPAPMAMEEVSSSRNEVRSSVAKAEMGEALMVMEEKGQESEEEPKVLGPTEEEAQAAPIIPRRNLEETAFFFPRLETNEEGEIIMDFTIPEALTEWKFLGIAHTRDLETGKITAKTKTQKEVMVVPNLPRFFREGDKMTLTAKVVNMTDSLLTGSAELKLFDARDMESVDASFGLDIKPISISLEAKASELLSWEIAVPENQQAIAVQVFARAGNFSDGEENILPVLTNRMLVTETLPFTLKSGEKKKKLNFTKLIESGSSSTLSHHKLTLDVSANPAWYAVQALPYLMEYPYECTEQVFSRFYANALATHIANDKPQIKQVFKQWKTMGDKESFLSNLEKNQELKYALLEESPWVLQAKEESQRKQRLGLLFDLNRMADEFAQTKNVLQKRQLPNGAFEWFPGMRENRYITQLIATGMGHLQKMGVGNVSGNPEINDMLGKAVSYLDGQILRDYRRLKSIKGIDLEENHLGQVQIQYLYMRSFFPDMPMNSGQEAYDYYYGQAEKYWNKQSTYMTGMLSLVFHRSDNSTLSAKLIRGLEESAVMSEKNGMYWKDNRGWFWWEAPIERQALLIQAFAEITDKQAAIDEMRFWLLTNKRTNDWETTRATVAACNALLLEGSEWLDQANAVEVKLGKEKVGPEKLDNIEAGTGHYQVSWNNTQVQPDMGKITVKKSGKSPAWGSVFWQYFEDLDKITYAETPLAIKKTITKEVITKDGVLLKPISEAEVKQGDKLIIRIELRVSQAMEYVHMKDMRAAGLEPINVISRQKYQGGLSYYETTKDASTNFFFGYLPEGTWVFEYPLRVNLPGDFSNGITTIQCMYAPEFTSHSEGVKIEIP